MNTYRWRRIVVCAMTAAMASCGRPHTDIVATTTEDVGYYQVVKASSDRSLTATVCVAEPSHADTIAQRIVQQLANHNFESITLDLLGPTRSGGSAAGARRLDATGRTARGRNGPARGPGLRSVTLLR